MHMPSFAGLWISSLFSSSLSNPPFLSIFLCMGASLGVMQFPRSQFFDWAHVHPGRLMNEFDFAWAVVCFSRPLFLFIRSA